LRSPGRAPTSARPKICPNSEKRSSEQFSYCSFPSPPRAFWWAGRFSLRFEVPVRRARRQATITLGTIYRGLFLPFSPSLVLGPTRVFPCQVRLGGTYQEQSGFSTLRLRSVLSHLFPLSRALSRRVALDFFITYFQPAGPGWNADDDRLPKGKS